MRRGHRPVARPADAVAPTAETYGHVEAELDMQLGFRDLAAQVVAQAIRDLESVNQSVDCRRDRDQARRFLTHDLYQTIWWDWIAGDVDRGRLLRRVATLDTTARRRAAHRRRAARARWAKVAE